MGCVESFSLFGCFSHISNSSSSFISNSRSSLSINDDFEDTVPLAPNKKKSSREIIENKEKNFSRIIPLLEEKDGSSTFGNVNDQLRLSNYDAENLLSSQSTVSLENELSDKIKTNDFLNQTLMMENSDANETNNTITQNASSDNIQQSQQNNEKENLLVYQLDQMVSTEDEGGISGEMDSSFDDS